MVIQVIVGVAHFFSSKNQLKFIKPKRVFSSIGQIIGNGILSCVGILGFLIVFGGQSLWAVMPVVEVLVLGLSVVLLKNIKYNTK